MMMTEIITRTPTWVFGLLAASIYLGIVQSKTRTVPKRRVAILPLVMIGLSLSGILSAFGASLIAIIVWLKALAIVMLVSKKIRSNDQISFSSATQKFTVPGSWLPMILMMAIFCTKYVVAVALAKNPQLSHSVSFMIGVSFVYGFLSSIFFARAWRVWASQKKPAMIEFTMAASQNRL
jgi:hypothetical protein